MSFKEWLVEHETSPQQRFFKWLQAVARTSKGLAHLFYVLAKKAPELEAILFELPTVFRNLTNSKEHLDFAGKHSVIGAIRRLANMRAFSPEEVKAELSQLEQMARQPEVSDAVFAEMFIRSNVYKLLTSVAHFLHLPQIVQAMPEKAKKFMAAYKTFQDSGMKEGAKALFFAFAGILLYMIQVSVFTVLLAKALLAAGMVGLAKWFLGGSYFMWGLIWLLKKVQSYASPNTRLAAILAYLIVAVDPGASQEPPVSVEHLCLQ